MKEKSNFGIGQLLPNHRWNEKQMVVMDPDYVSSLPIFDNLVCKGLVDGDIVYP